MRKFLLTVFSFLLLIGPGAFAQESKNISWTWSSIVTSADEAELVFKGTMAPDWHLYSSKTSDGGPLPFILTLEPSSAYEKKGGLIEPKPHEEMDDIFGVVVRYFESSKVTIRQKIKLKSASSFEIKGTLEGQVCKDVCESFLVPFVIKVDPSKIVVGTADDTDGDGVKNAEDKCPDDPGLAKFGGCPDADNDSVPDHLDKCLGVAGPTNWEGCPDTDGDGIADHLDKCPKLAGDSPDGCPSQQNIAPTNNNSGEMIIPQRYSAKQELVFEETECGDITIAKSNRSLWGIFIAGFLGGLVALMMPCIFPMLPLTVSFFTKQSKTKAAGIRNALIYGLSIVTIYTGLGLLITIIAGPGALNNMATGAVWNLLFFTIFIVFAASLLGAFEINLPSKFVNAVDKGSNKGGMIGIFFMAFTLCLVSFSCTGPIIGSLLVEAARLGSYGGPAMGMFGFSLALALPFALFAAFPGWLQTLPRSGSWMNSIKVTLGFIELALALKFLSVVDLAYHWGILKREIFISFWIAIFTVLGLYLFGVIKLSSDDERTGKMPVIRIVFAILSLAFAVYLLPGMSGARLKLMSGLAPPVFYTENSTSANHCPLDLECYHDYNEGMAVAESYGRPVMLDFTGWGCVNCRDMEENVWSAPTVLDKLKNDYIVISLYVDDRGKLRPGEQTKSFLSGEVVRTVGEKWKDFQIYFYDEVTQPQYVLLDNKGQLLARPISTTSIDYFDQFLTEGLCRYEKRKANR